jgi:hypothetical protein
LREAEVLLCQGQTVGAVSRKLEDGEYWVSKDVKGYQELKTLGAKVASVVDNNPMLRQFE